MTNNISKVIKQTAIEYCKENNCTLWDINNGLCDDFSGDVIQKMGGYTNDLYELSGDMFFNVREDIDDLKDMWGIDNILETNYGVWSIKLLEHWGYPPFVDLKTVDDELNHTWIYYNGKHYDAENPNGVENWCDILLIKKFFERYSIK